jgi:hypothetical protein
MSRWLARAVTAVAVWGLLLGYARLDDRQPHPVGLAAAVVSVLAVVWLCADAYEVARPPEWELYHSRAPARSFDPRFSRLSQELAESSSREAVALAVQTSVGAVADRILLDMYGVDRGRDPEAARRILGDQTADYLVRDPRRDKDVFTPQLSAVLTRLESL